MLQFLSFQVTCRYWKLCHPTIRENAQITRVRTESKTIRVVALSSLVTVNPQKLKNAILKTVPKIAINNNGLFPSWINPSSASSKIHGGVGLYDQDESLTGMKKKITKHIDIPTNPQNPKIKYYVYDSDIFVWT